MTTIFDPDYELKPLDDYYTETEVLAVTGLTPDKVESLTSIRQFPPPLVVTKLIWPKDLVNIFVEYHKKNKREK